MIHNLSVQKDYSTAGFSSGGMFGAEGRNIRVGKVLQCWGKVSKASGVVGVQTWKRFVSLVHPWLENGRFSHPHSLHAQYFSVEILWKGLGKAFFKGPGVLLAVDALEECPSALQEGRPSPASQRVSTSHQLKNSPAHFGGRPPSDS